MNDSTEYLDRLEADVLEQGHPADDLRWARDGYFRLLLSRVKSSPAQGEVRRAAARAREAGLTLEQAHGPSGAWAESVARAWVSTAPERFAAAGGPAEPAWSPRSALWGIPALAAALSVAFALVGLIPGWGPERPTLGWVLLPGLLAVPVVMVHAVYHATLGRFGNTRAVVTAVVSTVAMATAIAWAVMGALDVPLPPGVAWAWIALAGYAALAVVAWKVAQRVPGSSAGPDPGVHVRVHEAHEPVDDHAWERQFRTALFQRGVRRDRDVERAVQEALGHAEASDRPAVEEFGSPWDYARTLTEDPVVRTRRSTVFHGVLTLLWAALSADALLDPEAETTWVEVVLRGTVVALLAVATALRAREWRQAARLKAERRS
ncbi:hypothetical protein [Citricoccus sp. I39-566]|uniref:hypothetical protein n=1 Tax=Citricoccus sp. I39-566 TaxID=3073268 RepID=UPI00286B42DF|nr:hypothetical protein [Citricoccus sp. I39-566]WMY78924.1 hypothetical protein RE421_03385 [Citricoccus sp. I39-566]